MERCRNKILLVTYYFPPCGGSGVLRIVRFVKNIHLFGWVPYVLTVDTRDIPVLDYGSMTFDDSYQSIDRYASAMRVRLRKPSHLLFEFFRRLSGLLFRLRNVFTEPFRNAFAPPGCSAASVQTESPAGEVGNGTDEKKRKGFSKNYYSAGISPILKLIFELILIIDQMFEWAPRAVVASIGYVREKNIDLICSSSPPWSTHFVGLFLKCFLRKKWVMDLRDPIFRIEAPGMKVKDAPWMIKKFYSILESVLIRKADAVICNCDEIRDYFKKKYNRNKFAVVTNGYDPEDFEDTNHLTSDTIKHGTISYFGELYSSIRTPDSFLTALAEALGEQPELKHVVSINFFGATQYVNSYEFQKLIHDLGLEPVVHCHDYIPHKEVIKRMFSSDLLLLLQPHVSTNYQIPGKLYEYMAVGRPVLTIAPEGSATYNLIRRYNLGIVHDPSDIGGIKKSIVSALERNAPLPDRDMAARFSAREITKRFINIMRDVTDYSVNGPDRVGRG